MQQPKKDLDISENLLTFANTDNKKVYQQQHIYRIADRKGINENEGAMVKQAPGFCYTYRCPCEGGPIKPPPTQK